MKRISVSKATLLLLFFFVKMEAQQFVKLPFSLEGNTIIVQATVDNITGNFILDTGSPGMVLNSKFFKGYQSLIGNEYIVDLNGAANLSLSRQVKQAMLAEYQLPHELAWVTDLSNLEKVKDIPLLGILGYRSFKEVEIIIDMERRLVVIMPIGKYVQVPAEIPGYSKVDCLSIEMNGHIPYVEGQLDHETVRLGIDTGSEINILHTQKLKHKIHLFKPTGRLLVHGIGGVPKRRSIGWVENLSVIAGDSGRIEMALLDLSQFNKPHPNSLDGILGIPYFETFILSINYPENQLYFLERAIDEQLVAGKKDGAIK